MTPDLIEAAKAVVHSPDVSGPVGLLLPLMAAVSALPPDALLVSRNRMNDWALSLVGMIMDNVTPAQRETLRKIADEMIRTYNPTTKGWART